MTFMSGGGLVLDALGLETFGVEGINVPLAAGRVTFCVGLVMVVFVILAVELLPEEEVWFLTSAVWFVGNGRFILDRFYAFAVWLLAV